MDIFSGAVVVPLPVDTAVGVSVVVNGISVVEVVVVAAVIAVVVALAVVVISSPGVDVVVTTTN